MNDLHRQNASFVESPRKRVQRCCTTEIFRSSEHDEKPARPNEGIFEFLDSSDTDI